MNTLKSYYQRLQFGSSRLGLAVDPFYIARRGLYKAIESLAAEITGRTLDVGCGTAPYKEMFRSNEYIGMEIDQATRSTDVVDCYYDGQSFPFDKETFDSVFCSQVLEHVFNPEQFIGEIQRVLKAEGKILITLPFLWEEHEQPHDYARYSSFGLSHLLDTNGFDILQSRKTRKGAAALFQLWTAFIYSVTKSRHSWVNLVIVFLLLAPINLLGLIVSKILPEPDSLYLDNIILAKKRKTYE